MQLIAPDILAEARGVTGAMAGTIAVLGLALWLFGWRWHRFWVVAGITLAAGLLGLNAGRANGGTQVMAVGILLAVSAGLLALELAKVLAFVAGGCGAWLTAQWVLPQAQELWAVFMCGGLFGLLLYRLWTMLLTSLMGVLLFGHAGVLLVEQCWNLNTEAWVVEHVPALNGVVVGLVVLGVLIQALAARESEPAAADPKTENGEDAQAEAEEETPPPKAKPTAKDEPKRARWWKRLLAPRSSR
ncbi:MAG: hypothetical protein K2V38_07840 [Gemmataceae bacterium]|nr:hypothetical protein [Gemmataceae bacterium]